MFLAERTTRGFFHFIFYLWRINRDVIYRYVVIEWRVNVLKLCPDDLQYPPVALGYRFINLFI